MQPGRVPARHPVSLISANACLRLIGSGILAVSVAIFGLSGACGYAQKERPSSDHATSQRFVAVDAIMQKAVDTGLIPGGVVVIGHGGEIAYRKAFGWRALEPVREPMTLDTIFDLASLTKCVATTTSVMQLVQEGRIRLNDPVATYLPEFAKNGKADITVRELLTHYSGLAPDLDLMQEWQGRAAAYSMITEQRPVHPPGTRFEYSDINFETLGYLVEKVAGTSLKDYTATNIFIPLGMNDSGFQPPAAWVPRIAPTQFDENHSMLRGIVHDPTARRMGGIAGHAGLFSSADDLAKFADELLHHNKILSRLIIEKMTTPQQPATAPDLRGLGWDIDSSFSTNRGELLPVGSYGHTGFTGTSLWIDPASDTYIIILTNAVHPRGGKSLESLRSRVANAVTENLELTVSERDRLQQTRITGYNESMMAARRIASRNGDVKNGIDVLEEHRFRELEPDPKHPVRIGLVTNQTGLDANGRRTVDILAHVPGMKLQAIFSPEHGFAGILDTGKIGNSKDPATGTPIFSVYGDTDEKRRPTAAQMADLDMIVYDVQDAGVRFYTYETTLGYFLEAAAKDGKALVVLDRPNPLGGAYVQGPIADDGRESFVGYWQTPVRHGMTVGELARMFNSERTINAKLTVIPMEGWFRGDWFDSTGQVWINPSPNLRSLTEAILYPGIGLIEGTNISVGRGTDTPFEVVGAPWIDGTKVARYLNERQISGVRFVPVRFKPSASNFANQDCGGVNVVLTDRESLDAPHLGVEIAAALHNLYPSQFKTETLDGLLLNRGTLDALNAGEDPQRIAEDWQDAIEKFSRLRSKYLLY